MSFDSCFLKLNNISVRPVEETDENLNMLTAYNKGGVGYFEYHDDYKVIYISNYISKVCQIDFSAEITFFEVVCRILSKNEQFVFLSHMKEIIDGVEYKKYILTLSLEDEDAPFEFTITKIKKDIYVGTMNEMDRKMLHANNMEKSSITIEQIFNSVSLPAYYYDLNGNILLKNQFHNNGLSYIHSLLETHSQDKKIDLSRYPGIHFFEKTHYSSTHDKFEIHFELNQINTINNVHRIIVQEGSKASGIIYIHEDITDIRSDDNQLNKLIKANELIIEIKDLVDHVHDLNSMYDYLLSKIHTVIPSAKRACVLKLDQDDNMFISASYGFTDEYVDSVKLPFKNSFANSSLNNDYTKSVILNDIQEKYSTLYPDINKNTIGFKFESNMTAPLVVNGVLYGLLSVDSDKNNIFDAIDLNLFDYLKVQIERAIVKFKKISRVKRDSIIDPLTGIFNRRHLMDLFSQYLEKGHLHDKKFAFVLFDIDKLKRINDNFGHVAGDKVIKQFAFVSSNEIRETDVIARVGGDEFIGLFWDISEDVLTQRLNRWQELLKLETIQYESHDILTKFSYGISMYPDDGRTFEELLKKSDAKMYTQKL
ncbi:MAG: GGDEF domain-containing protein [Clostridiales bacterium]|nr:GGDEF domain-containing protein [Clostridiales bacterium]